MEWNTANNNDDNNNGMLAFLYGCKANRLGWSALSSVTSLILRHKNVYTIRYGTVRYVVQSIETNQSMEAKQCCPNKNESAVQQYK
mmetsp:Transcript_11889/g.23583  ORF Transcript_11889/g.23583 Transcript_11889/m.23583 type:complete len:86 (+) Transcript_11889:2179-2436(+)